MTATDQENAKELSYQYKGRNLMSNTLPRSIDSYNNVFLCAYTINCEGKYPFQQVLLVNEEHDLVEQQPSIQEKTLSFPQIDIFKDFELIELLNYAKVCLCGLLLQQDFQQFNDTSEFEGFYEYNGDLYMFFDITKVKFIIDDTYSDNNVWFTLVDEIVNHRKLSNQPIDPVVSNLFLKNDEFCFLLDDTGCSYEIPVVKYVSKRAGLLNFTYVFGEPVKDPTELFGPYYYFTDYVNANREAANISPKTDSADDAKNSLNKQNIFSFQSQIHGGIVRFAVFAGITKYIENHDSCRLEDDTLENELDRIADHDGLWTEQYDSIYLGHQLGFCGDRRTNLLVVKEYEQQVPISYHYVRSNKSREMMSSIEKV